MKHNSFHAFYRPYIFGFLLSIILTFLAYFLAQIHIQSHHQLIDHPLITYFIIGLAILQLLIQLLFFLHLGKESKPRWNLLFFLSTVSIILILVVGSLWIMNHLNYHMMPATMEKYIIHDEGLHLSH